MSNSRDIILPCARIVQGHPMEGHQKKDNNNQLKTMGDGSPLMNYYIAVAIAKAGEAHWAHTEWGQIIYQTGVESWPNGEHGAPTFAWKVVDGDSLVPDRTGKSPSQKEGFPGHWIIRIAGCFPYPCYHAGRYQPHEVIQNPNELKCGDYVRVQVSVAGNTSTQSPGIYVNPIQLELSRAGVQIVSAGMPDASGAFGGNAAVIPVNAQVDTAVPLAAPLAAPVAAPVATVPAAIPNVVAPVATVPGGPVAVPVTAPIQVAPVASSVPVAAGSPVVPAAGYIPAQ